MSLLPFQFSPATAGTLTAQSSAVESANDIVAQSLLIPQTEALGGTALPSPVKLLTQASQGSLSDALAVDTGDLAKVAQLALSASAHTSERVQQRSVNQQITTSLTEAALSPFPTNGSEIEQSRPERSTGANKASDILTQGRSTEALSDDDVFLALASPPDSQLEQGTGDAIDPEDGLSSLHQLVDRLDQPQVLAIATQRAETVDEVRSRLAPGIQPLPTPPQLAPVRFEATVGNGQTFPGSTAESVVVPTSNFGGAFANSVSSSRALGNGNGASASKQYLAQAYSQTRLYNPQPGFPTGAFPQPGYAPAAYPQAAYPQPSYPQPGYPQANYYYAQPSPQPYPQPLPGYALPQAYAPASPQSYPQGVYPQPYPQQAYVAQPYPQYPQPHQVQPYANQGYAVAYPPAGYPQPAYAAQPYPVQQSYPVQQPYPVQQSYPGQSYAAQPYPQPGYSYPSPGMTTAIQLPPLPTQGSAAPRSYGTTYAGGTVNGALGNPSANSSYASSPYAGSPYTHSSYANNPYRQPSSIGGRSELPPPPNLSTGNTVFALPSPPVGLSNATSAAVPPQALSEINLNRLPQIPTDPLPLEVPSASPMAADQLPSGIGGPLDFEAPTLELPPPPLQPRQEVNLPVGQPAPTFRSTASGRPESKLQAVFLTQGGDSAARARLSGTYPLTPNLLFGGSLDVASGDAFTDTTSGFSVNEAFASASLSQLPNLRLVAGQMDLTSYFDRNSFAKDSATHFFNPVFQTNPALSAVGLGSRPGLLANWSATDNLDLKAAAYSSSDEIGEFALDGFAGEVGFRTGNAIVRATYASGRDDGSRDGFREIFNIDRGDGRTGVREGDREEAYGINGELFIPSLNAGIFGRYGRYENRDLGEGGDTYSLGLSFLDVFTDEDRLGIAYGRDISNDELRRRFDGDNPNVLELFYDFRFLPNLRMGFTLQERDNFSELAAGFRLKAEFDTLPTGNLSEAR